METSEDVDVMDKKQSPTFTCVKPKGKSLQENQMWVEKYRPSELNGVISHRNILETVGKLVTERKLPHLLFYGPQGTGKTTTILACARKLNGPKWQSMTLELNASDERGINVIRERIKTFASTQQIFTQGFKLVILDEADAMTSAAQFALRRIIEKYTKNTRFCLICNYVNKIIPALQSRCTKFRFAPLSRDDMRSRVVEIAKLEKVNYESSGIESVLQLASGDMRKALNILQATHTAYSSITVQNVHECTGAPLPSDIEHILNLLLNKGFGVAFTEISKMQVEKGLALADILSGIHKLILLCKLDSVVVCEVLKEMADLEHRLTVATNPKIQLASLVGVFQIVRKKMFELHREKTR